MRRTALHIISVHTRIIVLMLLSFYVYEEGWGQPCNVNVKNDYPVYLDEFGSAIITPEEVLNNVVGGGCDFPLKDTTVAPFTFNCSNIGSNPITVTVTMNDDSQETGNGSVTVYDTIDPTAVCQDITVQLDASGNATITAADIDNGSTDNCSDFTLSLDKTSFTCADIGANTVTLTIDDQHGQTDNCTATVTVEDNVAPTAVCQDITVQLDASGNATITAADIDNGSTDNCSDFTLSLDKTSFTCADIGANTVTLTIDDQHGQTDDCTATVTVEDNVAPTAVCQDITVQLDASGNATITAADIDNGSTDNCSDFTLSLDKTSFTCADIGANTVTLTIDDQHGQTDDCTATVTVEDNVAPTAVCQDITVQLDASGNATITAADIDNGSTDNCSDFTLSLDKTSFTCADIGANTVTLTIDDQHGQTDDCTATVTVEDNVAPTAVCQDITVQLDASGNATITAADIDNGSTDNCSDFTLSLDKTSFTCADIGANTVTLTIDDQHGQTDDCTATVTVEDNVAPTAVCQDITVQLDASGNATITAADIDNGSTDNCSDFTLSLDKTSFTCADIGANTVTLTIDDQHGQTDDCTATVTVEDNVAPTAVCQDITVQLDASGNATITAADIDNGSTDNCSDFTLSLDKTSFTCADIGANTVTLTIDDQHGQTDNCTATVTVEDNVAPTAVCQDITVQLDASGNATITAADIDNGSTDNCSDFTLSLDKTSFTCADIGANTVTLTIDDQHGQTDDCTATVTVEDNVAPTAVCQDITVQLDASGNATITAADIDNGSTDNCSDFTLSLDKTSFTCADIGANTVTLTIDDQHGQTDDCTATVTVEDNVAPTAVCQDITVQLDASGNATITAADIDNGSTDNCSDFTLSLDKTSFTCADIGANTVTLTIDDQHGQTDDCTATVTVEDNVAPTAVCQDITVQLDASGNATITAADIDNGSTDNCSDFTLSLDKTSFTCADIGANTVTLTIDDQHGQTDDCTATVTVEDNVAPTAVCQDITVQLDASGNATITAADIDNGSTDNCSDFTLSLDKTSFTCADIGANTVTLTIDDQHGQTDDCTATVTVEDNVAPTAVCQDITVQLDASGNATITAADIDNGSTDNCSDFTLSLDKTSFTCADIGANTVTLTIDDQHGQTDDCTATVTVEDNVAPTAVCQDITVQLDASGNATITAADIDNGSTDNCSDFTLSLDKTSFTCADIGANTVTLTIDDQHGQTDDCTATVTVEDNVAPTAVCQDITVQLDASGNATITAADIDNGSTDNCSDFTLSLDKTSFTCADIGANTVTLTIDDQHGQTDDCTATVTVEHEFEPLTISITPASDTICHDATTNIELTSNNTTTFDWQAIAPAQISGASNGSASIPASGSAYITHQLTNSSSSALEVLYIITPSLYNQCELDPDTVSIWVEPLPLISLNPVPDTLVCDSSIIDFDISTLVQPTNDIRVDMYASATDPDLDYNPFAGNLDANTIFTDTVSNAGNTFGSIEYMFVSYLLDANGNPIFCNSDTVYTVVTVNPTPVVTPIASDTICSGETIDLPVLTPTTAKRGLKFRYTAVPDVPGAIAGFTQNITNGIDSADVIDDVLINTTNAAQQILYTITPFALDENDQLTCAGPSLETVVWVNPVPEITVTASADTVCDSTIVSFDVVSQNGAVIGDKYYRLETVYDAAGVDGVEADGHYAIAVVPGSEFKDTLVNKTIAYKTITYRFWAKFKDPYTGKNYCENATPDTSITIYLNPTPVLTIDIGDTIYCDDSQLTINPATGNGTVIGQKGYVLTTDYTAGDVTGVPSDGFHTLTDLDFTLSNESNDLQTVEFTISPVFRNPFSGTEYCQNGKDTVITVYLNPTPRFTIQVPDTICDSTMITFDLTSQNNVVHGDKYYYIESTASGSVSGIQDDGYYPFNNFSDTLINNTNDYQTIEYNITPIFWDPDTDLPFCENGEDTTIVVYLNPTPKIGVSIDDTIYCDLSDIIFDVNSPNGSVIGEIYYDLNTTSITGAVDGITNPPEYALAPDYGFTNSLVNRTDSFQMISYHFKAKFKLDGSDLCSNGVDTTINIYINPTPVLDVNIADTLFCDTAEVDFELTDRTGKVLGDKYYYLETSFSPLIDGIQPTAYYDLSDNHITDTLYNKDLRYHTVTYTIKPVIRDPRGEGLEEYCSTGSNTSITIYVNPKPFINVNISDTVWCDSSNVPFTVNSLQAGEGMLIGDLWYDVIPVYNPGQVEGVRSTSEIRVSPDEPYGNFSDFLTNNSNRYQVIDYQFIPKIKFNGSDRCSNGFDTLIHIYLNPTPEIEMTIDDTIFCDTSQVEFTLTSLNGEVIGDKYYQLETVIINGDDQVTGVQASGDDYELATNNIINDILVNNTERYQEIRYSIKPFIKDPREGNPAYDCMNGIDTSIMLYLNPTPRINISTTDTIYCNESEINFEVTSPNEVIGEMAYDLVTISPPGIEGYTLTGTTDTIQNFTNTLVNTTENGVRYIIYELYPKIINIPGGLTCNKGISDTIDIDVMPTLKTEVTSISANDIIGGWDISCHDYTDGEIGLQAWGGYIAVSGYSQNNAQYQWTRDSDGATWFTRNLNNIGAGKYQVQVTDEIGCTAFDTIVMIEPDVLKAEIYMLDSIKCYGDKTGELTVAVQGGTAGYTYIWPTGPSQGSEPFYATGNPLTDLLAGYYEVVVTDTNACEVEDQYYLKSADEIKIQVYASSIYGPYHIRCNGLTVDSLTAYSNAPNLSWEGPAVKSTTNASIYNVPAGTYTVTATDDVGCYQQKSFEVLEPEELRIDGYSLSDYPGGFQIRCYGDNNGFINLNVVTGGHDYPDNPYDFQWTTDIGGTLVQDEPMQQELLAGNYFVTVSDNFNCMVNDSFELTQPDSFQVAATLHQYSGGFNVTCNGKSDGKITVDASGGYAPNNQYKYDWSNGMKSKTVENLSASTYTLTVEDEVACKHQENYSLTQPAVMDINYSIPKHLDYEISCYGGKNGQIQLFPSGGDSSTYAYNWSTSNGEGLVTTAKDQQQLTAGSYTVDISDDNGCAESKTFELFEPTELKLHTTYRDISCNADSNGFAAVEPTGGIEPYSIQWSNGGNTARIEYLRKGTYKVTVHDANNCISVDAVQLVRSDSLEINLNPQLQYAGDQPLSCFGASDAVIEAVVNKGREPYAYFWSTGDTSRKINNVGAGNYVVSIEDDIGCTGSQTVKIDNPEPLEVYIDIHNVSCNDYNDGGVFLDIDGGARPYGFEWTNGMNEQNAENLKAGLYGINIKDANECVLDTTVEVTQPQPLQVDYDIVLPACPDMSDGSILADVTGGSGGYVYQWSTGETSNFLDNVIEDEYVFSVLDKHDCELIDTVPLISDIRDCLDIPLAFTPNGDGYNDKWNLVVISDRYPDGVIVGQIYPNAVIEVYNRWGELVFISTNGYADEWDGTDISNGKPLPVDSYHYIIDFADGHSRTGNVTIIR